MMTPDVRAMIVKMLATRNPIEVHRALSETTTYAHITYSQVRTVRRGLLEAGAERLAPACRAIYTPEERRERNIERKRIQRERYRTAPTPPFTGSPSNFLLRRQLETGQHFISCPDKMARALREAGMVAA